VRRNAGWFAAKPAPLAVRVRKLSAETDPTAAALAVARRSNSWGYQPTHRRLTSEPSRRSEMRFELRARVVKTAVFRPAGRTGAPSGPPPRSGKLLRVRKLAKISLNGGPRAGIGSGGKFPPILPILSLCRHEVDSQFSAYPTPQSGRH